MQEATISTVNSRLAEDACWKVSAACANTTVCQHHRVPTPPCANTTKFVSGSHSASSTPGRFGAQTWGKTVLQTDCAHAIMQSFRSLTAAGCFGPLRW
jgi:hypothetical protein